MNTDAETLRNEPCYIGVRWQCGCVVRAMINREDEDERYEYAIKGELRRWERFGLTVRTTTVGNAWVVFVGHKCPHMKDKAS